MLNSRLDRYSDQLDRIDGVVTNGMASHGIVLLRLALGLIFAWFGVVKFVPDLSPASDLAARTIHVVTGGTLPAPLGLLVLATWETAIGVALLVGAYLRLTVLLLFFQLVGTMLPLALFPEVTFHRFPYGLTLEGQYIVKNLVLLSGTIVVGATARGGYLIGQSRQSCGTAHDAGAMRSGGAGKPAIGPDRRASPRTLRRHSGGV